jgi:hypothetical protein
MSLQFLIRLVLLPTVLIRRGPRAYYLGSLALQALALAAALTWLLTPLAFWQVYGHWWMLLWLVPTMATIFAQGLMPLPNGASGRLWGEEGSPGSVKVAEPAAKPPQGNAGQEARSEEASGLEWLREGPPGWYRVGQQLLSLLTALCWALMVMLQWGLWLIVTGNLIRPGGIALGVVLIAAQMLTLFERRASDNGGPTDPPDSGRASDDEGPTDPPDSGRPSPVGAPGPAPPASASESIPSP